MRQARERQRRSANQAKWTTLIERVVVGLLAATLITPLIITGSTLFPFIAGKAFLFQLLVEGAAAGWLWLMLTDSERYRPARHYLLLALGVYVLVVFLSAARGLMPQASFWSSYERMDGWIMLAHVAGYILLLSVFLRSAGRRLLFLKVFLAVSALVHLYAVGQLLHLPGIFPPQGSRIESTLGNATYLATFGIFSLFLSLLLAVWEKRPLWRYGALANGVIGGWLVVMTATRGGILGLVVGLSVAGLLGGLWLADARLRRRSALGVLALALLAAGIWLAREEPLIKNFKPLERVTSISLGGGTVRSRLLAWRLGGEVFRERPLLGWGRESYISLFATHFNPEIFSFERKWLDRPHNKYVEVLVSEGLLGLIAYGAIFLAAGGALYQLRRRQPLAALLLAGLLVGYAVQNVSLFDHPSSSLLFGFTLGLTAALTTTRSSQEERTRRLSGAALALAALILLAGTADLAWQVNGRPYRAAQAAITALQAGLNGAEAATVEVGFKKALRLNTFGNHEIRAELARYAEKAVSQDQRNLPLLELALQEAGQEYAHRPLDVKFGLVYARLLVLAASFNVDARSRAEAVLADLQAKAPERPELYFEQGRLRLFEQRPVEAKEDFRQAAALDSTNPQYYLALAVAERAADQPAAAARQLAQALRFGADWRLAANLPSLSQKSERIFQQTLQTELQKEPSENISKLLRNVLAISFVKSGDRQAALTLVDQLEPDASQYIKNLLGGLENSGPPAGS